VKLCCITFTEDGLKIVHKIQKSKQYDVAVFTKDNYKDRLPEAFQHYEGIVFISSVGIAVRLCAPHLQSKTSDPAVVVVDDLGRYSISLVSGHLGGANQLAAELGELLGCQPVITTASEGRAMEAVDMFAKRKGLFIESMEAAKRLTAMMLEGRTLLLASEIPAELGYHKLSKTAYEGVLLVSSKASAGSELPHCVLRPRNITVGIGCRRGKSKEEILKAIEKVCRDNDISMRSIKTLATVDVKQDEAGILEACEEKGWDLAIFNREQLREVEHLFAASSFVKSQIGVASVCEPCACLAGGRLIVPKTALEGITIAIAKEEFHE
jgi:cobalt-precorrin 5A hydrolase